MAWGLLGVMRIKSHEVSVASSFDCEQMQAHAHMQYAFYGKLWVLNSSKATVTLAIHAVKHQIGQQLVLDRA